MLRTFESIQIYRIISDKKISGFVAKFYKIVKVRISPTILIATFAAFFMAACSDGKNISPRFITPGKVAIKQCGTSPCKFSLKPKSEIFNPADSVSTLDPSTQKFEAKIYVVSNFAHGTGDGLALIGDNDYMEDTRTESERTRDPYLVRDIGISDCFEPSGLVKPTFYMIFQLLIRVLGILAIIGGIGAILYYWKFKRIAKAFVFFKTAKGKELLDEMDKRNKG